MNNKHFILSNNVAIPNIGYGTWQITEEETVINCVTTAIKAGYRLIDTAQVYNNEKYIGQAIKQSGINREELFVVSKLWNSCRGYKKTIQAFEQSLDNLGLEYLDLYLIHWPYNNNTSADPDKDNLDTWRALEYLYKQGKIKAIGVSNFDINNLNNLLTHCEIAPMVNQVEFHPGYYQKELLEFCQANNILLQAWSPLGSGSLLNDITLTTLAKKYNVGVAQLCLNWIMSKNVLPLPKSCSKDNIIKNLDCNSFEISEDDIRIIDDMPTTGFSGLIPSEIDF